MKIKLTGVYVYDQEKALRFYTDVLGFTKKADFSNEPFRWLTVTSPDEPDGTEPQLALNKSPAAKAYQRAAPGSPPRGVTGSTIAQLNDTRGNLIQITQLARR
jgi:catechol 2,3-dioxygenase-like lactoylglutathione lyase family enzyme